LLVFWKNILMLPLYLDSLVHVNLVLSKYWKILASDCFCFLLPLCFSIKLFIFIKKCFSFVLLWADYFVHEHLGEAYSNYLAILFWMPDHQTYVWQFTLLDHELALSSLVIFKLALSLFQVYGLFETFVQTHVTFLSPSTLFKIYH